MRLHRTPTRRRVGFTLVELMVVMTIIAVLISLLTSAVVIALNKMDEVKAGREVGALASGLVQFQAEFSVQKSAPPSRLWLDETGTYSAPPQGYTAPQVTQLATDSKAYLTKVWPRLAAGNGNLRPVDWNCNGTPGDSSVILEGQQCLLFFIGGARKNGVFIGFSTDATDPISLNLTTRKGPYMQFESSRLNYNTPNNGYPCYLDPYGTPYAYFSSGKAANGYNAYLNTLGEYDCKSLLYYPPNGGQPVSIQPYYQPTPAGQAAQYYNPDTFQIISAGKNQLWGPGGPWASIQGSGMAGGKAGQDDLSNFYNAKLGNTP